MNDLLNFDEPEHRVESASAAFQKGIYHLFMLVQVPSTDIYAKVLRTYQCLFQLLLTQLLLDAGFRLSSLRVSRRLRQCCEDPARPNRSDIDPGALVTHTIFEEHEWKGFSKGHWLEDVYEHSFELYDRAVAARHNLLYRPFLLEREGSWHWEDCTLDEFVPKLPGAEQVEGTYRQFRAAMMNWATSETQKGPSGNFPLANIFLASLSRLYDDLRGRRPAMTLLLSYASLLNAGDENMVTRVREYEQRLF